MPAKEQDIDRKTMFSEKEDQCDQPTELSLKNGEHNTGEREGWAYTSIRRMHLTRFHKNSIWKL